MLAGPSYSIHTSWSGGVSALELGIDLIRKGFCEAAVVTTASLIFYRATATEYADMNLHTPGGRCRSFDADGNHLLIYFLSKITIDSISYCNCNIELANYALLPLRNYWFEKAKQNATAIVVLK